MGSRRRFLFWALIWFSERGLSPEYDSYLRWIHNVTHQAESEDEKTRQEQLSNEMRLTIRGNLDVHDALLMLERQSHVKGIQELIEEALQIKDLGERNNILLYAASIGKDVSFASAVRAVGERLGRKALVKQLRESDVHGAPLPFQAAASSSTACFEAVCHVIRRQLGESELRDQLQVVDLKGRSIIFHAVKAQSVDVFTAVVDHLMRDAVDGSSWLVPKGADNSYGQQQIICGKAVHVDVKGMNVLHFACRWGCPCIMDKVVSEAKKQGDAFLHEILHTVDAAGRTPLMQTLRQTHGETCDGRASKFEAMVSMLRDAAHHTDPDTLDYFTQPASTEHDSTALMHAAFGGPIQLRMVCDRIVSLDKSCKTKSSKTWNKTSNAKSDDAGELTLDFGLGIEDVVDDAKVHRYGLLLKEAARGGHVEALEIVVHAIQTGVLRPDGQDNAPPDEKDSEMLKLAISTGNMNLLAEAISGRYRNVGIVEHIIDLIEKHILDPQEAWNALRGPDCGVSNLVFAASMSESLIEQPNGAEIFHLVYCALVKAAKRAYHEGYALHLRRLFIPSPPPNASSVSSRVSMARTPLAAAMLSRDKAVFQEVYNTFHNLSKDTNTQSWTCQQVVQQIPTQANPERNDVTLLVAESARTIMNISPTMLLTIIKAVNDATPAADETARRQENGWTTQRLQRLVQAAAELGAFDLFRVSPFYHEAIPCLLERIGDYEENVISAVMLAMKCSRNPFVMCAVASRHIDKTESDLPMHRIGLRRLQAELDKLSLQILDELPHTIRGVGKAFGAHESALFKLRKNPEMQGKYNRLAAKMGFIVTQWMLEPSTIPKRPPTGNARNWGEDESDDDYARFAWLPSWNTDFIDPLHRALDRGSGALDFVNAPLLLDYMSEKFSASVPPWTSGAPFSHNVSERFYTHTIRDPSEQHMDDANDELRPADLLIRFLQGWGEGRDGTSIHGKNAKSLRWFIVPHLTLLPGLQFTLAGAIGVPARFYEVPAIRWFYGVLSYIAMLGLFVASVRIESPAAIPAVEKLFYIFIAGLLWREALEFRDFLPTHRTLRPDRDHDPFGSGRTQPGRISTTIHRYFFQDAWNILDASTIFFVVTAFVLRVFDLRHQSDETDDDDNANDISWINVSFSGQVFLAGSAIPLFSRVLSLSQIDGTLGPMTQIIWRMMSHLAKFSVVVAVLMASFAMTFHVLFHTCKEGSDLYEHYDTFGDAYITMFKAMLGTFDFDSFKRSENCSLPREAETVGITLLVLYLAMMSILLLNLLIAVLSTAHAEVYANAEKEFHLARAKLIQQSWQDVQKERQPPPINLIMPGLGLLADAIGMVWHTVRGMCSRFMDSPGANSSNLPAFTRGSNGSSNSFRQPSGTTGEHVAGPVSETYLWDAAIGAVHRGLFAAIVGTLALAASVVLWVVSTPWIAWQILRRLYPGDNSQSPWRMGYARPLLATILKGVGWALACTLATALSITCAFACVALWLCGLWGIGQWWRHEIARRGKGKRPLQRDWVYAENLVSKRNGGDFDDGRRQFRVDVLVKETTGLDVEALSQRMKRKERELSRLAKGDLRSYQGIPESLARQVSQASRMSNSTSGYSVNFNMTGTTIPDVGSVPPLTVGGFDLNHSNEAQSYSFQLSRASPSQQEAIAGNQS